MVAEEKLTWLNTFVKPLYSVSKNFSLLSKTKGLELTLKKILEKAPPEIDKNSKEKLYSLINGLDKLPLEEKKERIKALLNLCESLNLEESSFFSPPNRNEFIKNKEILKLPVETVKGIGKKRAKIFARKGINTIEELLFFFPKDYEDRRSITPIAYLREGITAVVKGEILESKPVFYSRKKVFEALITDGTGNLVLKWFHFKEKLWRSMYFPGKEICVIGEVSRFGRQLEMIHPEVIDPEKAKESGEIGRIVPVYPSVEGIKQKALRGIIKEVVEKYAECAETYLPEKLLRKRKLLPLSKALKEIHLPSDTVKLKEMKEQASVFHKSIAYDEFFFLELAMALRKGKTKKEAGICFKLPSRLVEEFLKRLPFELTDAQKKVVEEIKRDMAKPIPMNRLIQGDVGSGKTVVAFIAALIAIDNGYQVALMAPTEILAQQHYQNFRNYAQLMNIHTALLTGSTTPARRREIYHGLKAGYINFVIGTHALFQESVEFKRLGLVIIDEQHRFGVLQKAALREKAKGVIPDTLVMTATPIPRTLALTIYGDLDVSIINEMPKGRKPVKTELFWEKNKHKAYQKVKEELEKGHQAYVILPLVEESEKMDLLSVKTYGEYLQKEVFPDYQVGILHGKLSSSEKETIMRKFKQGEIHVLVSTTVVEVGVDVPNATVMVIEHAERFGLSQIHQLRGRVGRSELQSYCFLIAYKVSPQSEAYKRLKILCETTDGFRIAEEDLKLRGPGEFLGTKQSGFFEFKKADMVRDYQILLWAREDAFEIIKEDPELKKYYWLKDELWRRWEERLKLSEVA